MLPGLKKIRWMDLKAAGHFRPYSVKRKTVMFRKICPVMKNKRGEGAPTVLKRSGFYL